jgi:hypothetical protein
MLKFDRRSSQLLSLSMAKVQLRVYVTPDMDGYARLSRSLLGPPGLDDPEADRD